MPAPKRRSNSGPSSTRQQVLTLNQTLHPQDIAAKLKITKTGVYRHLRLAKATPNPNNIEPKGGYKQRGRPVQPTDEQVMPADEYSTPEGRNGPSGTARDVVDAGILALDSTPEGRNGPSGTARDVVDAGILALDSTLSGRHEAPEDWWIRWHFATQEQIRHLEETHLQPLRLMLTYIEQNAPLAVGAGSGEIFAPDDVLQETTTGED